jgi:hypothetical protein
MSAEFLCDLVTEITRLWREAQAAPPEPYEVQAADLLPEDPKATVQLRREFRSTTAG